MQPSPAPLPDGNSNLALVQAALLGQSAEGAITDKDSSLILLEASDEWEAAEHLALWLAAERDHNQGITIICTADTELLDLALSRHGLPRLGRSESSRWREVQQVLPLMMANAWEPVDLAAAGNRLQEYIDGCYPGHRRRCEWPVTLRNDQGQLMQGWIDMLLHLPVSGQILRLA